MSEKSPRDTIEKDYIVYLSQKSNKELLQILSSIDKGKYPDRHGSTNMELSRRGYDTNDLSVHGIWRKLANDLGAVFERNGFGTVRVKSAGWEIKLDTYLEGASRRREVFTRISALYANKNNFNFKVYRRNLITPMLKLFGYKTIIIGDKLFDDNFVVRSNDERVMKQILWDQSARNVFPSLLKEQRVSFKIVPTSNDAVSSSELYFRVLGIIDDIELLKKLFSLFEITLQQLYYAGYATKESAFS